MPSVISLEPPGIRKEEEEDPNLLDGVAAFSR
jgi:hypothetical protein